MQRIRKNDLVQVIAGRDKGKRGKVKEVFRKKDRVVVEGLMLIKKHTKPSQKNMQGGIVEQEGTIHISNVMPIDPSSDRPTRVGSQIDGEKRRRSGKSGTIIEGNR